VGKKKIGPIEQNETTKGTSLSRRNKSNLNTEQNYIMWRTTILETVEQNITAKGTRVV
jgi:hypothetical protein